MEFRELRSGSAGQAGSLLTIDRSGQAVLQTLPLGSGSKTERTRLTCDELAWLPQQMKQELAGLRPSYGDERSANEGELSVVYRWESPERRVVWRNPESSPKPPQGQWAGLVAPLEDIRRRAAEPGDSWPLEDAIIGYNQTSGGIVGTYFTLLTINKIGRATLRHGLGIGVREVHEIQLAPEELATLLRTFKEEKFADFQRCYGKHQPVNRQNTYLFYLGDHDGNSVTWMAAGSDPKPPQGWFRIVAILDQIRERAEKQTRGREVGPRR